MIADAVMRSIDSGRDRMWAYYVSCPIKRSAFLSDKLFALYPEFTDSMIMLECAEEGTRNVLHLRDIQ